MSGVEQSPATDETDIEAHNARVALFCRDLERESTTNVIRKHITTGAPATIPSDVYFELRRRVAQQLEIHPSAVILVGSCRLGFSLKQKGNPGVRYKPATPKSDLDFAIVSPPLFNFYWDRIFSAFGPRGDWAVNNAKRFIKDLFCGWITPDELPSVPHLEHARAWAELFGKLTNERPCGIRRISGRLYKDWGRLESYQAIMVDQCQLELKRNR